MSINMSSDLEVEDDSDPVIKHEDHSGDGEIFSNGKDSSPSADVQRNFCDVNSKICDENEFHISEVLDFEVDPKEMNDTVSVLEFQNNQDNSERDIDEKNGNAKHCIEENLSTVDQNEVNETIECKQNSDVEGLVSSEEEGLVDDTEEGEVKDGSPSTNYACRYFQQGKCRWGSQCRFFHVSDKGLYNMLDMPLKDKKYEYVKSFKPLPSASSASECIYHPEPVPYYYETSWDRALNNLKEAINKAKERKEENDFEEKKLYLSPPYDTVCTKKYKPSEIRKSPRKSVGSKVETTFPKYNAKDHNDTVQEQKNKLVKPRSKEKSPPTRETSQNLKQSMYYQSEWRDPWRRSRSPRKGSSSPRKGSRSRSRSSSLSSLSSVSHRSKHSSSLNFSSRSSSACSCSKSPPRKRRKRSRSRSVYRSRFRSSPKYKRSRYLSASRSISSSRSRRSSLSRSYGSRSSSTESYLSPKRSNTFNKSSSKYPSKLLYFSSLESQKKKRQRQLPYKQRFKNKSRSTSRSRTVPVSSTTRPKSPKYVSGNRMSVDMSISSDSNASPHLHAENKRLPKSATKSNSNKKNDCITKNLCSSLMKEIGDSTKNLFVLDTKRSGVDTLLESKERNLKEKGDLSQSNGWSRKVSLNDASPTETKSTKESLSLTNASLSERTHNKQVASLNNTSLVSKPTKQSFSLNSINLASKDTEQSVSLDVNLTQEKPTKQPKTKLSAFENQLLRFHAYSNKKENENSNNDIHVKDINSVLQSSKNEIFQQTKGKEKASGEVVNEPIARNVLKPKITLNLQPKTSQIKLSENCLKYNSSKKSSESFQGTLSRRDQLLQQLKAVEEAIARKKNVI